VQADLVKHAGEENDAADGDVAGAGKLGGVHGWRGRGRVRADYLGSRAVALVSKKLEDVFDPFRRAECGI
jgi:hypothetical protein